MALVLLAGALNCLRIHCAPVGVVIVMYAPSFHGVAILIAAVMHSYSGITDLFSGFLDKIKEEK